MGLSARVYATHVGVDFIICEAGKAETQSDSPVLSQAHKLHKRLLTCCFIEECAALAHS